MITLYLPESCDEMIECFVYNNTICLPPYTEEEHAMLVDNAIQVNIDNPLYDIQHEKKSREFMETIKNKTIGELTEEEDKKLFDLMSNSYWGAQ